MNSDTPCTFCRLPVLWTPTSGTGVCQWCDSGIFRDGERIPCGFGYDIPELARRHRSLQRDVEPDYWPKLVRFLDQFPRDEAVKTDFDPDPFT